MSPPLNNIPADYLHELGLSPAWKLRRPTADKPPESPRRERSAPSGVERMDWAPLSATVEQCTICPLCSGRKKTVFGVGDRQASVLFVGEGPGADEDRQGEPFVGEAGKLLDKMLFAIQLNRKNDVYITNIVKCRPPGNRNPEVVEIQACLPYLQRQIALIKPRLIVALGRVAAIALLNKEASIGSLRQKLHDTGGIPLVVTYHPAYLLRSPMEKAKSWDDLRFIRRLLREQA